MATQHIEFDQAVGQLEELIEKASRGEEIVITRDHRPVVRLVPSAPPTRRQFGSGRGRLTVPGDFDEPLDDFTDYA
ncbi:MAG: type II toxin-antitoxin system prevent-host-death family antitoxin [Myxococcota bacterium]